MTVNRRGGGRRGRGGRPGTGPSARRELHVDWLSLVEVTGPFLSVPVLADEWPDLEALDRSTRDRLRLEHGQWQDDREAGTTAWIEYVLRELLGWGGDLHIDGLADLSLHNAEHDTTVTPSFALIEPDGKIDADSCRLLGLICDDLPTKRIKGSTWAATPVDRLAQLCRHHGVELGLATDGRWWTLVWAPRGGVTTTAVFDAISWPEAAERDVVRAFVSLLERRRFFAVAEHARLPALFRKSLDNQEELTDRLGVQVRQAVELLVAAIGRADARDRDHGDAGLSSVSAHELYHGAVTVMMRVVFLLFAEERGLLPADNELYAQAYSVGRLYEELEQRVQEAGGNEGELEHTMVAWHRLLALFTAIYRGIDHPQLHMTAHDGSIFDPDAFPWLEGRARGSAEPGRPIAVDDRTVLHMLRSVQYVVIGKELRRVTFRTLDVEQIGYVYEGLLSFEGFRAADTVVGLIGKEGQEEEVALNDLERLAAETPDVPALAAKLSETYKDSRIGSPKALAKALAPLPKDERGLARPTKDQTRGPARRPHRRRCPRRQRPRPEGPDGSHRPPRTRQSHHRAPFRNRKQGRRAPRCFHCGRRPWPPDDRRLPRGGRGSQLDKEEMARRRSTCRKLRPQSASLAIDLPRGLRARRLRRSHRQPTFPRRPEDHRSFRRCLSEVAYLRHRARCNGKR